MFRRFLLAVGLAGAAYSLYNNASPDSKNKVGDFVRRATSKLNFRDWLALIKK
jgi:hypothetical protein